MIPSIKAPTSICDPVRQCEASTQRLSFEDLKAKGFAPITDKTLKVTNEVYIYSCEGKPLILAASNFFTEQRFYDFNLEFKNFIYDSADELTLLLSASNEKGEISYRTIPLEGETLLGRGLSHYNTGYKCTAVQEKLDLILSDSPIEQLKKLGFIEHDCFQQTTLSNKALQPSNEKTLQELLKLKEYYSSLTAFAKEKYKGHDQLIATLLKGNEVALKNVQKQIDAFETKTESLEEKKADPVEQTKIYIKEILDEINHQHKVFLVECKGNQVNKIFTTVYKSDPAESHEIKGEIIDVDFKENPTFILQDAQQKKSEVRFHWRDSVHHDYFTVFCKPID